MERRRLVQHGGGAAGCLVLLALVTARPPENPAVYASKTIEARLEVPSTVARTLRRACFDCHSNSTRWPWYSQLPPGVWMVSHDVKRARAAMNFSDWPDTMARVNKAPGLLMAACAVLRAEKMPPERYLMLHGEARLKKEEVDAICEWSRAQAAHIAAVRRTARPTN